MKNLNELAKEITLREGKKKSLTIAQVKEVLGILSDLFFKDWVENIGGNQFRLANMLLWNGEVRDAKKKKPKSKKKK